MSYPLVTLERRDAVALLTLNRPEKLNAWTPAMAVEQARAIEEANADPRVGAIVMTGAGRGFCAGADMEATFTIEPRPFWSMAVPSAWHDKNTPVTLMSITRRH